MDNQRNNGRGIFYGVIGVATLVVAIIGATFAYFTATQNAGQNEIDGNMATINFDLSVTRVSDPGASSGLIPMSNTMVEEAVSNGSSKGVCKDTNGNAVCQIYKIEVKNGSTATMFVDGYVALTGGSGTPTDTTAAGITPTNNGTTTMRWAQVFTEDEGTTYSTEGTVNLTSSNPITINSLDNKDDNTGFSTEHLLTTGTMGTTTIEGNSFDTVNKNFIRISDHATEGETTTLSTTFNRTDVTSMLVLSQQLTANDSQEGTGTDEATYYFVVWLSETGTNQTAGATTTGPSATTDANIAATGSNFFDGVVAFNSSQGSEVTATFNGYTSVKSDMAPSE